MRVSCGWPSRRLRSRRKHQAAACWSTSPDRGGHTKIFISPLVADSKAVAESLVHELVHAAVGLRTGYGREFRLVALRIGLEGPMRATRSGAELRAKLERFIAEHGEYPGQLPAPLTDNSRKQGTRLRKVVCPGCGYTIRVSAKWIAVGLPRCPCGREMEEV